MTKSACSITVIAFVAQLLGGCGEIPLKHDHYTCDIDDSCPPGMTCVYSAELAGSFCRFEDCLPSECAGCCAGEGTCQGGDDDVACGAEGRSCVDCAAQDLVCLDGECVHPCRVSCSGCCDPQGNCLDGDDDGACGTGGEICVNCTGDGLACESNLCVDPCTCTSGACCDGCNLEPSTTKCDTTAVDTEERCSSSACGARRDERGQYRYCTGSSAHCSDDNLVWEGWTTIDTCLTDEICQVDSAGQAICSTCVGGCTSGVCACLDLDWDGHVAGATCPTALVDDCDDNAPGITGACQANGCPQGWVLVDAGDFEMGCNDGEITPCYEDERPRRTITLTAYCIQPTEVTVADYRACYDDLLSGCTSPGLTSYSAVCNFDTTPAALESHPINCVSWTEARTYCQEWVGGDLPSEAQWEKAARGGDQRMYPWGADVPDCTRCNWDQSGADAPYGCGDVPEDTGPVTWEVGHISGTEGDSPYGLKDMAGNLWEYVLDCYEDTGYPACGPPCADPVSTTCTNPDRVAIRGGAWNEAGTHTLRAYNRFYRDSKTLWYSSNGIRCVRTP